MDQGARRCSCSKRARARSKEKSQRRVISSAHRHHEAKQYTTPCTPLPELSKCKNETFLSCDAARKEARRRLVLAQTLYPKLRGWRKATCVNLTLDFYYLQLHLVFERPWPPHDPTRGAWMLICCLFDA